MLDASSPSLHPWKAHLQGWALRLLQYLESLLETTRRRVVPAPVTLFRDVTAPWLASVLCVAARLELSDKVGERAIPLDELAQATELSLSDLKRLLEILSAHGYFAFDSEFVHQTPLSRALSKSVAGSFTELQGRGWYRQCFLSSHVMEGIRTSRNPFEVASGQHFFDYLETHPEASHLFSAAMDDVTRFCTPYLASEIRLAKKARVLDVGGGNGELVRTLATRFPSCTMAVLDRSLTTPEATYQFHQGSFFDPIPTGYDHLLLKNVLHDWNDDQCRQILTRCREAVTPGAKITMIECLLPEPGRPPLGNAPIFALDWNVWLTLSGQERRASELRDLLQSTGWQWQRTRPTATPYSLLEATAN